MYVYLHICKYIVTKKLCVRIQNHEVKSSNDKSFPTSRLPAQA